MTRMLDDKAEEEFSNAYLVALLTDSASDLDTCMPKLLSLLRGLTKMETVVVLMHDHRDDQMYQVVTHIDSAPGRQIDISLLDEFTWASGGCRLLLGNDQVFSSDMQSDFPAHDLSQSIGLHGFMSIPIELKPERRIVATLCGLQPVEWHLPDETLRLATLFAEVIATAMERSRAEQQARDAAITTARILREYTLNTARADHRLRTGLTVVGGWLRLLADDPDLPRHVVEGPIATALRRTEELETDLRNLLDHSRTQLALAIDTEPMDIGRHVRATTESCTAMAPGRVEFVNRDGDAEQWAYANGIALRDAMEHLIDNALVHSTKMVTVATELRGDRVVISVVNDATESLLASGGGDSAGAGLGLSVVRAMAVSMGATVDASRTRAGAVRYVLSLRASAYRPVVRHTARG